ncbi:hypothetical protein ACFY3U_07180 [Micromonospora sp. NPDC000089]|uniref:hypothetical protein n=1 Tax=unclassified Micromonospora TaxID=2617518 RepID=UPI00367CD200
MNEDRLRFDLAELADDVNQVDLRDRALRTSRRIGLRRTVTTSAAALVMIAAAGTALAIRPDAEAPAPAPAGPSVAATPRPTPSASPGRPPTGEVAGPAAIKGFRYYLGIIDTEVRIHRVGPTIHEVKLLPLDRSGCTANSVTVSPDGKQLAWVKSDSADGSSGTLVTTGFNAFTERTLATGVTCVGARPLVWQDGRHLMATKGNRSVLFDAVAGRPAGGVPGRGRNRCWSADGTWQAGVDAGGPFVTNGRQTHRYTYAPPTDGATNLDGWQVRSVSMDGRYVSIGWSGTDPSRQDGSFTVVDTTTSRVVDLPGGPGIRTVVFTADHRAIVQREASLTVLDADLRELRTAPESPLLYGRQLLTWVP